MSEFKIQRCLSIHQPGWLPLRSALWPSPFVQVHLAEMEAQITEMGRYLNLVALAADGTPAGFAEASLRHDYVNGTSTSPVAFVEGIYVKPEFRRQGVAQRLMDAVVDWARDLGCQELASDALLDNTEGHEMHQALGFQETERVVYFRKPLGD